MWSLYQDNKYLKPLSFLKWKKHKESIVEEVLILIKKGVLKLFLLKGVCEVEKSAYCLNIARELGKTR
jgi:hypothetical protein